MAHICTLKNNIRVKYKMLILTYMDFSRTPGCDESPRP